MHTIAVCSGKGGVGKTTVALNLAILLSQMGKKVVLVDSDVTMANIGIALGIERAPISLHNVLSSENVVADAVYEGPANLKYVPSGLSLEGLKKIDFSLFGPAIADLEKNAEFLIIDCPPGLEAPNQQVIKSAKELLLVTSPDPASLADALKVKQFAARHGIKIAGVVVNRVRGSRDEVRQSEIESLLGNVVVATIPEDPAVRTSTEKQSPLVLGNQGSPAGIALKKLAAAVSGEKIDGVNAPETGKKGFLQAILESLFGKKNQ